MLGEPEKVVEWLRRAIDLGYLNYPNIAEYDPIFQPYWKEASFRELMKEMKAKWEDFQA